MECDKIQNNLVDYIENNLAEKDSAMIRTHINTCKNCEVELKEMQEFLALVPDDMMELPSENLRKNFEQMLSQEKKSQVGKLVKLRPKTDWKSYLRVAASVALLISAFLLGKYQTAVPNSTIAISQQQNQEDEKIVLALFDNQSASKRIQAVNDSYKFENTDTKIIQAIINRLFFDENTNVRLAAAEALSKFASLEMVKTALIKSLETEENPSIQIELIQILAKIQEKRALEPMKKLLNKEDVPDYVKQELQFNISSLL